METQINHDEMYEDFNSGISINSQYPLSTRIEGRIRYAFYRMNVIESIGRALGNWMLNLSPVSLEEDREEPRSLESFFLQVKEEKEARRLRAGLFKNFQN